MAMPQTSSHPGTYRGADLPVNWGILGVPKCSMTKRVFGVSDPSFSTHFHAFTLLLFSSAETVNRQRTWAGAPPPKRTFNDFLLRPTRRISPALTGRAAAARWAASRLIQDRTAMPNHLLVKRTITDLLQIDTTTRQASSRANVLIPAQLHLVQWSVQPQRPTFSPANSTFSDLYLIV
jgi:hypothetical protein